MVGERKGKPLHSIPFSFLNEISQGQSLAWLGESVGEENRMNGPQALRAKKAIMR